MIDAHMDHAQANRAAQPSPLYVLRSCLALRDDAAGLGAAEAFGAHVIEDEFLLARLARRDHLALGDLFDHFSDRIHEEVVRIVGNETEAEELVEKVFWNAWQLSAGHEPHRHSLVNWLLELAREQSAAAVNRHRLC